MTVNAPKFLRRDPPPVATLETGVRDILAKLKASADSEVCEVLAGATNVYSAAIIRFRGNQVFTARDIDHLITVWQILLDVKREPDPVNYAARSSGPKSGSELGTDDAGD